MGYLEFADLDLFDLNMWILVQNTLKLGGSIFFFIKEPNANHTFFVVPELAVKIKYPNPGDLWIVHIQFDSGYFVQINAEVSRF